ATPLPRRPGRPRSIAGPPAGYRARSPAALPTLPLAGPAVRAPPAPPAPGTSPDAAAEDRWLRLIPTAGRDHTGGQSLVNGTAPRHHAPPPQPAICRPTGLGGPEYRTPPPLHPSR